MSLRTFGHRPVRPPERNSTESAGHERPRTAAQPLGRVRRRSLKSAFSIAPSGDVGLPKWYKLSSSWTS